MYFLRKKSKASYFQHKSLILILNNRLKKLEKILKNTTVQKVHQSLEEYKIFLSLNLSYLNVFVKVFNKIRILNPKFLLQHYLNLLDKFKLLRFNYRFALYKQGLHKIQNVMSTKLLRYKKSGRFLNAYKQNRHGFLEEKQQFILATQLNSALYPYKFFNFKVKNFLNVFYKKFARFELRSPSRLLMQETQSNLRKSSNLVRNQIYMLKNLEKRSSLLKRRVANNYHYFLKFLKLKRVYKFDDTNLKKSIKSTLNILINRLSRRGHSKARIRKYLGKRYVFLLFKKFINQKYGRQSILKLRLFFFKQKASYVKQRYKYRHLKKNNKLFAKFSKHFFQQSSAKLFNSVN